MRPDIPQIAEDASAAWYYPGSLVNPKGRKACEDIKAMIAYIEELEAKVESLQYDILELQGVERTKCREPEAE
jgi:hypothetical protein